MSENPPQLKRFSNKQPTTLPISETFVSIQGEGKLTGIPSLFIRISGCNLRCTWCDTPYASWAPEQTLQSIDSLITMATESGAHHIVITGGEPMIFDQVANLCNQLQSANFHITIETAGTIYQNLACDLMSISPKLANSTPINDPRDPSGSWAQRHEQRRLNTDALTRLINTYPQHQLKFVITGPDDLTEIDALLANLPKIDPADILLMPEGTDKPSKDLARWVAKTCQARNWRYCHRLHIELFGNARGT